MIVATLTALALVATDLSPPPAPYDSGPYTARTIYVTNPNQRCQQLNGYIHSYKPVTIIACYVPKTDTVIMPYYCDPRLYKPSWFCKALYRHELGHARGGMHVNGVWVKGYWVK